MSYTPVSSLSSFSSSSCFALGVVAWNTTNYSMYRYSQLLASLSRFFCSLTYSINYASLFCRLQDFVADFIISLNLLYSVSVVVSVQVGTTIYTTYYLIASFFPMINLSTIHDVIIDLSNTYRSLPGTKPMNNIKIF